MFRVIKTNKGAVTKVTPKKKLHKFFLWTTFVTSPWLCGFWNVDLNPFWAFVYKTSTNLLCSQRLIHYLDLLCNGVCHLFAAFHYSRAFDYISWSTAYCSDFHTFAWIYKTVVELKMLEFVHVWGLKTRS